MRVDRNDGSVVLVTGASRGIGEAMARRFAARGDHTILCSRNAEACEHIADSIRAAGGSAEAHACHTGQPEQIEALFALIAARHGRLDVLVNNAATNPYYGPVVDAPLEAFQKTFDVNVRGYFLASQAAVRLMRQNRKGSIVNVSSVNAVRPGVDRAMYAMSKASIVAMTQAFAREHAPEGIRVNALLPGATDTRFAARALEDESRRSSLLEHIPLGRVASPGDIASAALYLASSESAYVTGTSLVVDGGYLLA